MDKDYVWEADYGERTKVFQVTRKLLVAQSAQSLQCISYFVNNNPYNLEFYIYMNIIMNFKSISFSIICFNFFYL